jgi:predicted phage baseplate assembly protein
VLSNVSLQPRNPLPAAGGIAPESVDDVKLRAPAAFRRELVRAVTADDYARLAERHPAVQRAAAVLRFTGASTEVHVAIDPLGTEDADPALLAEVGTLLEAYRRIGHDVLVVPAIYVPLLIGVTVCMLPGYLRGHVTAAIRTVLGNRRTGFFHPDRLTFGDDVFASRLVAAVQAVPGVDSVEVTELRRFDGTADLELEDGVLRLGPSEVARLDDDPDFPENGRLELTLKGGR